MAYRLSIENTVHVPVKFTLNNAGKAAAFSFSLKCDRLEADELKERIERKDLLISDFLRGVVKGWQGQTLVVDEDGKPAEFGPDALDVMLATAGLGTVVYMAYMKECGAKEKN